MDINTAFNNNSLNSECIKYFTILGERCSGTNYIEKLISKNFDITYTNKYGYKDYNNENAHKHFFRFSEDYSKSDTDQCLFICIIRDPYEWIGSLYCKRYHLNPRMFTDKWNTYLTHAFYSVYDNPRFNEELYGKERMGDRHIYTNKRYKNIFEARSTKAKFMLYDFPKLVKHCVILRYEDVRDGYEDVLDNLCSVYNLRKLNKIYENVDGYKGEPLNVYSIVTYKDKIDTKYLDIIRKGLNEDIEYALGYYI